MGKKRADLGQTDSKISFRHSPKQLLGHEGNYKWDWLKGEHIELNMAVWSNNYKNLYIRVFIFSIYQALYITYT